MTTETATVNVEILFFGGTYGSLWSPDEFGEKDDQGDAIDSGSVKSFKGYLDHLGKCYVEALAEELEIPDGKISFESTSSPQFYNFGTDRLFVDVDQAWLTGIVESIYADEDMREAFESYLGDHFTSYDGFSSFYSNEIAEWEEDFIQDGIGDSNHVVCGTYLSFWMQWQHKGSEDNSLEWRLYYSICDSLSDYVQGNWDYEYPAIINALWELQGSCVVQVSPPTEPGLPLAAKQFEAEEYSTIDTYCAIVEYLHSRKGYIPTDIELTVVEGSVVIDCPGQLALPL